MAGALRTLRRENSSTPLPLFLLKTNQKLAVARAIAAKEGFGELYHGLSAGLLRQATYTTARLGIRLDLLSALTGIVARRFWDEGTTPSDVATRAAELALSRAGVGKERLGALLNTSVCRDFIEPSTACLVHGNLGLPPSCLNFDVGNACLAFLSGIQIVGNMIDRGQIEYGLVVDVDHGFGIVTRYGHLSTVLVRNDAAVAAGNPVGLVGRTGRTTGDHLHYEVLLAGRAVDPSHFLEARRHVCETR